MHWYCCRQTLDMPALGHQVLLCIYYTIVDPVPSTPLESTNNETTVQDKEVKSFKAVWRCPCVQGNFTNVANFKLDVI